VIRNSNLSSLIGFNGIEKIFTCLDSLDISNNLIKSVDQLDYIKNVSLVTLNMINNPVLNENGFINAVRSSFKCLKIFNQSPWGTLATWSVSADFVLEPIQIGYFQNNVDVYNNYLNLFKKYYGCLDKNRADLPQFYHQNSYFSLTLTGNVASQISTSNRNHNNNLIAKEVVVRLYQGDKILNFFNNKFDKIEHDSEKFCFDVYSVLGFMNVVVMGELTFYNRKLKFEECFILGDGKILNQQLNLFYSESSFTCLKITTDAMKCFGQFIQMVPKDNKVITNKADALNLLKAVNFDVRRAGERTCCGQVS